MPSKMPTLRANGPEIDRLIEALRFRDPAATHEEISERTRKLGPGKDWVSPRTLRDARNSGNITLTRMHALATVLKVPVESIVLEKRRHIPSTANLPMELSNQTRNKLYALPLEVVVSPIFQRLVQLPESTMDAFLSIAASMTSFADEIGLEQKKEHLLRRLAHKDYLDEVEDPDLAHKLAATRHPEREQRFERNTRTVVEKAVNYLNGNNIPQQRPDQTFLDYFVEGCEKASDENMQELWAQMLAAKIERPNEMSLRTLRMIQDINQDVAGLFEKLCSIVFEVDNAVVSIRLDESTGRYLSFAGLSFDDLMVLSDYGFVTLGARGLEAEPGTLFKYFSSSFRAKKKITCRVNPLTVAGKELRRLVSCTSKPNYFEEVVEMLDQKITKVVRGG